MNRRNTFAAVAAASALIAILAAAWFIARQDRFDKLVNSIISTPQSYDGEHVDKLVALGSEGVPAIGKALTRGEEFPLRFVLALEQIGDARGARSIMAFVGGQAPYSDVDRSFVTARTILSLSMLRDTDVCEPLASILEASTAHPRVRLSAASTCAKICAAEVQSGAREFILTAYEERTRYLANPNEGFTQSELYAALIDVDSDESLTILLGVLDYEMPEQIVLPIMAYLSGKRGDTVINGLFGVLDSRDAHSLQSAWQH